MPSLKKGFLPILLPLILLAILLSSALFYLYKNPSQSTKKDNLPNLVADKDQVLFNYIPNFDDLNYLSLPSGYTSDVYDYNGHKIVIGHGQVIEYDIANNRFIRISDNKKIKNVYSGTLIGDSLYISHSNQLSSDPINFKGFENDWWGIDKIDLKSGKVVATYFGEKKGRHFINLNLEYFNNFLWASSWNGIMKIDPETMGILLTYFNSKTDIGEENSCPGTLYTTYGQLYAVNSCDPINSVYYYNLQEDKWILSTLENRDAQSEALKGDYERYGLNVPIFVGTSSNIINGKRYLFTGNFIYTLKNKEFPKKLRSLESKVSGGTTFVDKTETFALIVNVGSSEIQVERPTISNQISAVLVNIKQGEVVDLIKGNPEYEKENEKAVELMYSFIDPAFEETASSILVKDKKSGKIVATFDKATKQLQVQP